ncbi:putative actin-related protein 3 [Trypanosoma cruzi]|uniref:Putative actin-related protein 3 n=1 Tax=Trypanosoma cruzi TaxID=5693 RepID=A0A2V2W7N9_TRYCR|nr:putative actin-related protein 3 [Trypanosoma cruzi]
MSYPVVVIDNGTGYTKMGYAGNEEPTYIIPSLYADNETVRRRSNDVFDDLDFYIGEEAAARASSCTLSYPIKHGIVEDWDKMERIWQHCIYKYLRVEPEEHGFILTEPPANPPENREYTAEVMFETFGVKQLHIAVQGALALRASWTSGKAKELGVAGKDTGLVIDSGAGVTHVIPIVDGFVLNQAIQHIPLAGRDITNFVLERLRERGEPVPPDDALLLAQRIKEQYCYIARDIAREFDTYDRNLPDHITKHCDVNSKTGQPYTVDVGYEKFLGPEVFFHPEIFSGEWTMPLPEVVDRAVWSCPIDCRRPLYRNIVLSGGTTMFPKFDKRLQKDLRVIVDRRAKKNMEASKDPNRQITYDVNVVSHDRQRYAVWYGGSMLGSSPEFSTLAKTKEQYEEYGPYICRQNNMFHSVFD